MTEAQKKAKEKYRQKPEVREREKRQTYKRMARMFIKMAEANELEELKGMIDERMD